MHVRLAILLSATVATAIPLRRGNTWTWLLVDRGTDAHSWRRATVLDSSLSDSGTVWTIQGRDSSSARADTARLLRRRDGSQAWLTGSQFLPWEPEPRPPSTSTSLSAAQSSNQNTQPFPWGAAFLMETPSQQGSRTGGGVGNFRIGGPAAAPVCQGLLSEFSNVATDCPLGIWSDSAGLERARLPSLLSTSDQRTEWILQSFNGKASTPFRDSLLVPDSGSTLVWLERSQTYLDSFNIPRGDTSMHQQVRTWTIASRPPDSVGWRLARIHESLVSDSGTSAKSFNVRWNPITGERYPPRSACPDPDDGWWRTWPDSVDSQGRSRSQTMSTTGGMTGDLQTDNFSWTERILLDQGDSLRCQWSSAEIQTGIPVYSLSKAFTRLLVSHDDIQVRPKTLSLDSPNRRDLATFPLLAALHPSLLLRWRDVRGRTGRIPASTLLHGRTVSGWLFLDATLPDGSRWSGSWLAMPR